jgi:hypothetical protein
MKEESLYGFTARTQTSRHACITKIVCCRWVVPLRGSSYT